jgi:hypothetical protein
MNPSSPMPLPYTPEAARLALRWGTNPDSAPYTHKQIAEWCERFWSKYVGVNVTPEIDELLQVLTDVDTQWELFLENSYTQEELRTKSFETVRMPEAWFSAWLQRLEA